MRKGKIIKANRRDTSKVSKIIFTNIAELKKEVCVPDWLKYLFG